MTFLPKRGGGEKKQQKKKKLSGVQENLVLLADLTEQKSGQRSFTACAYGKQCALAKRELLKPLHPPSQRADYWQLKTRTGETIRQ